MSLLEGVLATAHRIEPVEHRILIQVEAATVLHHFDKPRSISILKNAVTEMRQLLDDEKQSDTKNRSGDTRRQRLKFQVLRKIAAIDPAILKDLSPAGALDDQANTQIKGDWTEEARAVISVASDQIETNPQLAARLAEQSMSFGYADWQSFLRRLGERDGSEAERLASVLMKRLGESSLSPVVLINLKGFVFAPGRSSILQSYFFQSLSAQLRRDLRPDTPIDHMEANLYAAREAVQLASTRHTGWQVEFQNIANALEAIFTERSLPIPGPPGRRVIDVSSLNPAALGDTQEISAALSRAGAIKDSQVRDREYQKLAAKAALNADVGLAGEILSRISDEDMRREATLTVYSPLVRKSIAESNWVQAQKQAFNIQGPLGRTLALDSIAQAMSRSGEERLLVINVYRAAMAQLERDWATEEVAKAFLVIARSLFSQDPEVSLEATKSAISTLNKVAIEDESLKESAMASTVSTWVRLPNYSLKPDEVLDIADMIGTAFKEMAKRDVDTASSLADGFVHRGLHSLARVAISKVLLDEVNEISSTTKQKE